MIDAPRVGKDVAQNPVDDLVRIAAGLGSRLAKTGFRVGPVGGAPGAVFPEAGPAGHHPVHHLVSQAAHQVGIQLQRARFGARVFGSGPGHLSSLRH